MARPTDSQAVANGERPREGVTLVGVATGGVLGASARWFVGELLGSPSAVDGIDDFPLDTLTVNVLGCLLIAIAASRFPSGTLLWAFAVTGVLGGFTTMSTFAVELNDFADTGRNVAVIVYLAATLGGAAVAFAAGEALARRNQKIDQQPERQVGL